MHLHLAYSPEIGKPGGEGSLAFYGPGSRVIPSPKTTTCCREGIPKWECIVPLDQSYVLGMKGWEVYFEAPIAVGTLTCPTRASIQSCSGHRTTEDPASRMNLSTKQDYEIGSFSFSLNSPSRKKVPLEPSWVRPSRRLLRVAEVRPPFSESPIVATISDEPEIPVPPEPSTFDILKAGPKGITGPSIISFYCTSRTSGSGL